MTMLKKLPEKVLNLWNKWEIRGMLLVSLLLQIILIIFGSRRKYIARSWARIFVWCAYLSADLVATVALVQVGVALQVFSRSWGSSILAFIAIPMLIVGIIRYAERTWVLRSSCSKSLKNTFLSKFRPFYPLRATETLQRALGGNYLRQAYTFFDISMFMMQDLVPGIPALMNSQLLISSNSADDAFKVVEVELGLIYDIFYTKAPLIYSFVGIIFRSISFLLFFTAFITFQVMIDKHAYSTIDITITYLLFAGSAFHEIYAFSCLVFPDWTMIWLIDEGGNTLTRAIYSLITKLTRSKRWSRSIAQHNLISFCIENKPLKYCLELLGILEMTRQVYVNREDMNVGLRNSIFGHLQKKCEKIKENFNFIDTNFRRKIIGHRGDGVLEREGQLHDFKWCTTEVEFSRSLLVWHLATDICYFADKDANNNVPSDCETSKCLSEYMMYLLVARPNMLPKGIGDIEKGYLDTCQDLELLGKVIETGEKAPSKKDVVDTILLRIESYTAAESDFLSDWRTTKSVLDGGYWLARQLRSWGLEKRWRTINEVWIEMLAYAAAHCPWKEHAQQLRRGGELLTHVSFLMLHLGLSERYEYFRFEDVQVLSCWNLTAEEQRQCSLAILRYELGNAGMSVSSADEEVKELKKALSDKDRELELARSLLAASTQQQQNTAREDNPKAGNTGTRNHQEAQDIEKASMIKAVLVINTQGKPRLTKFYDFLTVEKQQELIRVLCSRAEKVSNFMEADSIFGPDSRLVYKHYATLYFVFVFDSSENELAMLDLIQETLDKCFRNVCELDIVFNYSKLHAIIDEIISGGQVLETSSIEVMRAVEEISKLEAASNSISLVPKTVSGWRSR
ncbi:hypothetical protein NC652_018629 [Populus alba x Populus x berolinensis]|nr:hypothetical protein NC652_018629 [Populus alba x Populus x berolinensis]